MRVIFGVSDLTARILRPCVARCAHIRRHRVSLVKLRLLHHSSEVVVIASEIACFVDICVAPSDGIVQEELGLGQGILDTVFARVSIATSSRVTSRVLSIIYMDMIDEAVLYTCQPFSLATHNYLNMFLNLNFIEEKRDRSLYLYNK